MRRVLIAAVLAASLSGAVPARATGVRCTVVATGITLAGCRYTATGPGTFAVATASGFVVSIARPGEPFRAIAQGTGPGASAGEIPSAAGDLVDIAIKSWWVRDYHGNPVVQIQDGTISAAE